MICFPTIYQYIARLDERTFHIFFCRYGCAVFQNALQFGMSRYPYRQDVFEIPVDNDQERTVAFFRNRHYGSPSASKVVIMAGRLPKRRVPFGISLPVCPVDSTLAFMNTGDRVLISSFICLSMS